METHIIDVRQSQTPTDLAEAVALLQQGQLVAFPTETVYGLGGSAFDSGAVKAIYAAKGRPSDNPLIVHVCSIDMAYRIASSVSDLAITLMKAFWPGPLTLVLPKHTSIPPEITGGLDTVAVRMPDHPVALALIRESNLPLAAPSANISGRPSPTSAHHVMADLQGRIPLILDGGPCREGVESTVLDISRTPAVILRPGAVTYEMLLPYLPELRESSGTSKSIEEIPKAPGMKYGHYAPKAPVYLYTGSEEEVCQKMSEDARRARSNGEKIGVIITEYHCIPEADLVFDFYHPETTIMLQQTAQNLFRSFRACDDGGVHRILLQGVSEKDLGRALMNRMVKAAKEWFNLTDSKNNKPIYQPKPLKVLLVCTGNTCRSPMAQALAIELHSQTVHVPETQYLSAGLSAIEGEEANVLAKEVMREMGLSLEGHRAQSVNEELLEEVDLILTMTNQQRNMLLSQFQGFAGKTFVLNRYIAMEPLDIVDPFGQSKETYHATALQLKNSMTGLMERLSTLVVVSEE